jgi:hypothetical protein
MSTKQTQKRSNGGKLKNEIKTANQQLKPITTQAAQEPGEKDQPLRYRGSFMLAEKDYPVQPEEVFRATERPLAWFEGFAGKMLYVLSIGQFSGLIHVVDIHHAAMLYNAQQEGYRFMIPLARWELIKQISKDEQRHQAALVEAELENDPAKAYKEAIAAIQQYNKELCADPNSLLYTFFEFIGLDKYADTIFYYKRSSEDLIRAIADPAIARPLAQLIPDYPLRKMIEMLSNIISLAEDLAHPSQAAQMKLLWTKEYAEPDSQPVQAWKAITAEYNQKRLAHLVLTGRAEATIIGSTELKQNGAL